MRAGQPLNRKHSMGECEVKNSCSQGDVMEKQLSFQLESCPSNEVKRQQKTEKPKQPDTTIKQFLQEQLPGSKEEFKLGPLSLGKDREKPFSEASTLKENSLEQTSEKERLFDNLINVETVAESLGVAPKTVHNWVYLRKIPYVKCGQKVLFRPKSLKAWLNRKEVKSWL